MPTDTRAKNPVFVESGRAGARNRWGAPRVVRLDELTPAQRDLVLALVQTMKAGPVSETPGPASAEVPCDGGDRAS